MLRKKDALDYHSQGRHGKIEVISSKPCLTQRDLSLAYTPGVAEPVREIEKNPEMAFNYTARGNLVAVVTNGTAVLGLGDVGGLAGKPVMEGKAVLFKRFADIDVFDIELNSKDPEDVITVCKLIEPTFGGINLEDIKAPDCFYIEEALKEALNIPVFHDDQHGTAIISGAALLNALEIIGKNINEIKMTVNGAGAAGYACADLFIKLGVKKENIIMCDSIGVIYKGRKERMNPYKERFASDTDLKTLEDAMAGCDVFVGLSVANCVTQDMVKSMNDKPIIFALANPDPEITYEEASAARDDLIMASGRSDYPNQVNNVLGFPFIFRGALDVRARMINDKMKIAAVNALAALAKEDVPESVIKAYEGDRFEFGPHYIIPKPFDPRILIWEASAVAQAAMDSGTAQITIDIEKYKEELDARLGKSRIVMRGVINKAKKDPKKIVFPEGNDERIIKAALIIVEEGIAKPILLGNKEHIQK
ncbi:NADP-dependent malic enzyme, partial [bacterium]|nr:NADP-dependent malic enzyme [bacterium]